MHFILHFCTKKRRNTEKNYRFQDMEIPRFFIHFRRLSSSTLVTNILLANSTYLPS